MIFDLTTTEVFDLYKDRSSVQVNRHQEHVSGTESLYENQTLVLRSNDQNHNTAFHINFLLEKGTEYVIELQASLKDTRDSCVPCLSSRNRVERDFVKATVLVEARKPSKKLFDREIQLRTSRDRQTVTETFSLPFTAISERSMIGMIISEGPFELRVNYLTVRKVGDTTLDDNNREVINDTLSHIASSESIVHLVNNDHIDHIALTTEMLKQRVNAARKAESRDTKGSLLEDTDYESTLHGSDDSDQEHHNKNRKSKKHASVRNRIRSNRSVSCSVNDSVSGSVNDSDSDRNSVSGSDEESGDVSNRKSQPKCFSGKPEMPRSKSRCTSAKTRCDSTKDHCEEESEVADMSILTENGKHNKITVKGINAVNRAKTLVTGSEISELAKACQSEDKEEVLGKCKDCCATISRGPRGEKGEEGPRGATGAAGSSIFAITINWMGLQTDCLMSQTCPSGVEYVLETRGCEIGACKLWQCQNGTLQWLPNALDPSVIPASVSSSFLSEYDNRHCTLRCSACSATRFSSVPHFSGVSTCSECGCRSTVAIQTLGVTGAFDTSICPVGPTGSNFVCGEPVFTPLWFYDPSSCKLIRIVDKTCRQFIGNPGDKIIDTENGIVYEANRFCLWKPLPGSLKGPTGSAGPAFVTINTAISGGLSASNPNVKGAHGLSGETINDLPDATTLAENTLFYEMSTGRVFIIAGISYGYVVQAWVLLTDLESDLKMNLLKTVNNTFCDPNRTMIWRNNEKITANLATGDHVLDTHTGNQYLVSKGGADGSLQYIGCLKGTQGPQGPEGPAGKGIYDQILLQPAQVLSPVILPGGSTRISVSKALPVVFGNSEKLFNVVTNRIELPNYLVGPILIKMNLFLMVGHASNLTSTDRIGIAVKKSTSLVDWTLQTFGVNTSSSETFITMTEVFTGNPGDVFDIQLRNLTNQPITIKAPQIASGNRLFFEFNQSSS